MRVVFFPGGLQSSSVFVNNPLDLANPLGSVERHKKQKALLKK